MVLGHMTCQNIGVGTDLRAEKSLFGVYSMLEVISQWAVLIVVNKLSVLRHLLDRRLWLVCC